MPMYRREGRRNPYRGHRALEMQSSDWATPAGVLPHYLGRPEGRTCAWHYSYTSINADGAVAPCCGLFGQKDDFGYVSAAAGSFGRLWNNANFETVRRDFPQRKETKSTGPTTACMQCTKSEAFRDHYALLDREIMRKYWSFNDEEKVRNLDEFYTLLQTAPAEFAAAYAGRYNALAIHEIVDERNQRPSASLTDRST
jgi:hypothetical protein